MLGKSLPLNKRRRSSRRCWQRKAWGPPHRTRTHREPRRRTRPRREHEALRRRLPEARPDGGAGRGWTIRCGRAGGGLARARGGIEMRQGERPRSGEHGCSSRSSRSPRASGGWTGRGGPENPGSRWGVDLGGQDGDKAGGGSGGGGGDAADGGSGRQTR